LVVLAKGALNFLHIAIGEGYMIAPNIVLGIVSAFIAWRRYKRNPIGAK
jgi:hypothetical protein